MPSFVEDLLEIADSLVQPGGPGRPRQAPLRRAVSTAYYAVFNRLSETCADTLIGWSKPWEVFTPIYRSVDHDRALAVLSERNSQKKHPLGDEIERVGVIFRALQAAREWADYSPEPHPDPFETLAGRRFSREQATQLVANAREAIALIDNLGVEARLVLVTRLIAKQRR